MGIIISQRLCFFDVHLIGWCAVAAFSLTHSTGAQCVEVGGVSEVAVLGKPMLESAHWGWVEWWSTGSRFWSSNFSHLWPKIGPKWLWKALNGPFEAMSRSGGSKLVDQRGSRLDQVRAHPGRCVATYSRVRNGHQGPKMAQKGPKWPFCGHKL